MIDLIITVECIKALREGILPLWDKTGMGDAVLSGKRVGFHSAIGVFKLDKYLNNPRLVVDSDFTISVDKEELEKLIADFKWNCMDALWNNGKAQGIYFVLATLGISTE